MLNLEELDDFLEGAFKPDGLDYIYYVFWEKGITLEEFNRLPIPYIMRMVQMYSFVKEKELEAAKNAGRN